MKEKTKEDVPGPSPGRYLERWETGNGKSFQASLILRFHREEKKINGILSQALKKTKNGEGEKRDWEGEGEVSVLRMLRSHEGRGSRKTFKEKKKGTGTEKKGGGGEGVRTREKISKYLFKEVWKENEEKRLGR